MNSTRKKRLQKLSVQIDSLPVPRAMVDEAFETFRSTGHLPDQDRLAAAVVRRTRTGSDVIQGTLKGSELAFDLRVVSELSTIPPGDFMAALYREALSTTQAVRIAARAVLELMASLGLDVTQPDFAKHGIEVQMPEFGSVGLHLLGFPEHLAVPPYEEQARRLFERFGVLRARTRQCNQRWVATLADAVGRFRQTGELPEDELVRDVVLADAELLCLIQNWMGRDVVDAMAALTAAQADPAREGAVARPQELVQAGEIRPLAVGFRPVP